MEKDLTNVDMLEKIYFALGQVSMCWDETPKGIFLSSKANEVAAKLWEAVQAYGTRRVELSMKTSPSYDAYMADGAARQAFKEGYYARAHCKDGMYPSPDQVEKAWQEYRYRKAAASVRDKTPILDRIKQSHQEDGRFETYRNPVIDQAKIEGPGSYPNLAPVSPYPSIDEIARRSECEGRIHSGYSGAELDPSARTAYPIQDNPGLTMEPDHMPCARNAGVVPVAKRSGSELP